MSALIRGITMPTSCMLCPFCVEEADPANGEMCMVTGKLMPPCTRERLDDCPLVEIPPHGRLIDADALRLLYDFNGYKPTGDMTEEEFDRLMCRLPVIRASIDDAPTVIEAEEGEEDAND